ncbi:sulfurtransferase complex subunit TusB [Thiotrichales bacterium 19S3-7]|nr:sulfurtransferase complex subunit TusB [Thiotrichales bacterium 19S3-7]MCF6801845.1 sulfurtransferase complex subunit TusB [Thiotrichales bacterium 19S3-11]
MILHKLNSTSQKALDDLESLINHNDALILIEDAIYLPYLYPNLLEPFKSHPIYIIESDVHARGMTQTLAQNNFELINYDQFVELCCQYEKSLSWFG